MIKRTKSREILAWMALAFALVFFSVTMVFSQTKSVDVRNENGKVHLKIITTENGVTKTIDTTFESNDEKAIEKIIADLDDSKGKSTSVNKRMKRVSKGDKHSIVIDLNTEMTEEDKKRLHSDLKESMKDMEKGLEKMRQSLQDIHIHINSDLEKDLNFDFNIPDIPNIDCRAYAYSFSDEEELDSLEDDDHFVVSGDDNEEPPVLEKVITSKNGKKLFVYKRSSVSRDKVDGEDTKLPSVSNLRYFPNPSTGHFTLSFNAKDKGDINITVIDDKGIEVYSEKMKKFEGEYSRDIDLSNKSKGTYVIKLSQGNVIVTKKIVLN